jgi:hypothetical protein
LKQAVILSLILITIILAATVTLLISSTQTINNQQKEPVYVGVAFCGNTTTQAKALIDHVRSYTNLFVLDCGLNPISANLSAAREISDYAINAGLYLIINLGTWTRRDWPGKVQFLNESKYLYGNKFLGCYYDDDVGGVEIDYNWTAVFIEKSSYLFGNQSWSLKDIYNNLQIASTTGVHPENYSLEATWFNNLLEQNRGTTSLRQYNITYLTSDYALYWFDYLGGYATILAQFGWNNSVNQQIGLVRGAATLQNKDWGVIITWKYMQPPYLDTAENIYTQMENAYNAGAKYITIFDYPQIGDDPYGGSMTDAHFQALKDFWENVIAKSTPNAVHAQAALVLPKDYGWGMRRGVDDRIWGFWGPDDKSPLIWKNLQTLLNLYGPRLDIVYDDPAFPLEGNYSRVYYWNQTL